MLTRCTVFLLLTLPCLAQVAIPTDNPTVDVATIPDYLIGLGPSWQCGSTYPLNIDTILAKHLGRGWLSWTDISTPIARVPVGGSPVPSTLTSGLAYVGAQSKSGAVSLVFILRGGISSSSTNGAVTPVIAGDLGIAFKLRKWPVYVVPCAHASNPVYGVNGALVQTVLQPGVMVMFGIGGMK